MEEHYGFKPDLAPPPAFSYAAHPPNPQMYPPTGHPTSPTQMHPSNPAQIHPPIGHPPQAYRWVDSSSNYGTVPPTAVQGGMDADGHAIFVGRAYHEGDLIPAKVIPGKNAAYVAHNGEEHCVDHYQVLCKQILEWVPSHAGQVPPGAVQGGHTSGGEVLYVGRAFHEDSQTIGKVHPSHGVCYIPYDGEEIACPEYEILVLRV